jgi:hypothetical protein
MRGSDEADRARVLGALEEARGIRTIRRRNPRLQSESLSETVAHEIGGKPRAVSGLKVGSEIVDKFLKLPRAG